MVVHEPQERSELRDSLMSLDRALAADDATWRFDLPSLQKHNIHIEHMSLDKGSAHNPRFFAPYPNVPPVTDEIAEEATQDPPKWGGLLSRDQYAMGFHFDLRKYARNGIICEEDSPCSRKKDWPWAEGPGRLWNELECRRRPGSPGSLGRVDESEPEGVSCPANRQLPHINAVLIINGDAKNGEFLRAEILAALRMMIHQMRLIRLISHMKTPAMVLSIMGNRVRLIEAFCEDGKIIFRATRLYELPGEYIIASQQIAEWFYGSPIGDTS